jgi:hypothetical protein
MQRMACLALLNLAVNDANKVTLVAAEAHVRIIRAMVIKRISEMDRRVTGKLFHHTRLERS